MLKKEKWKKQCFLLGLGMGFVTGLSACMATEQMSTKWITQTPSAHHSDLLMETIVVTKDPIVGSVTETLCSTPIRVVLEREEKPEIPKDDLLLLARLIMAEAGNQDRKGKELVADVVLNRVDSDLFPNTISEVIYQNGQFTVVDSGALHQAKYTVTEECFDVALSEWMDRKNDEVIFFSKGKTDYMIRPFKHGDHWFGEL